MKFFLLGPLQIYVDGRPRPIRGQKLLLLMAVLLMAEGRLVSTEKLIDALWGEDEKAPDKCLASLHTHVKRLRDLLGCDDPGADDALIPHCAPGGYRMQVAAEDVDLHRFRRRARELQSLAGRHDPKDDPRIVRLGREALGEWGAGDTGLRGCAPLANLSGTKADGYRQELRRERRAVLIPYLEGEVRQGNAAGFIADLAALHSADPSDERLFRILLSAHEQAGNRVKVVDLFNRFKSDMCSRYDATPDPKTEELFRRITDDVPELGPPSETVRNGAAMPPPENADLARRMSDVLAPRLPFLTGAQTQEPDEWSLQGAGWSMAKELWTALHKHDTLPRIPEARRSRPDIDVLCSELAGALARDRVLAKAAAAILGDESPAGGESANIGAQVNVSGHYFHQGDTISGTSIKYYGA